MVTSAYRCMFCGNVYDEYNEAHTCEQRGDPGKKQFQLGDMFRDGHGGTITITGKPFVRRQYCGVKDGERVYIHQRQYPVNVVEDGKPDMDFPPFGRSWKAFVSEARLAKLTQINQIS